MSSPLRFPRFRKIVTVFTKRAISNSKVSIGLPRQNFNHQQTTFITSLGAQIQRYSSANGNNDAGSDRSVQLPNSSKSSSTAAKEEAAVDPVSPLIRPISATYMLSQIGQSASGTVLPLLTISLGLNPAELGIINSAAFLTGIACNIPTASLASSIGRRPLLIAGPAIGALGMACVTCSTTMPQLLLCTALNGVASSIILSCSTLCVADISTETNRAQTSAPLLICGLLGVAIGPSMGGYLAEVSGNHVPFFACTGLFALAAVNSIWLPETARELKKSNMKEFFKGEKLAPKQWVRLLKNPRIQGLFGLSTSVGFGLGSLPVTAVIWAYSDLSVSPSHFGMICTTCILTTCLVLRPICSFSDQYKKNRPVIMISGATGMVSSLAMQSLHSSQELFACFTMTGTLSLALVIPNVLPFIMEHVESEDQAQALALRNIVRDSGAVSGALLMGAVATYVNAPFAMMTTAGIQSLGFSFFAWRNIIGKH